MGKKSKASPVGKNITAAKKANPKPDPVQTALVTKASGSVAAEVASFPAGQAAIVGKPVSASRTELIEAVFPNDANFLGGMLGGRVMHLIDITGALAAARHANSHVVTASVDYLDFRFPIQVGEFIVLRASVNRVFHTSMEVGVKVFAENVLTGALKHTSSAYLTFVALDASRQPHPAPPLILETDEDRRRYEEAKERRDSRMRLRHKRAAQQPQL